MNTIVNECINNPNYDILTQYNPEQLCALSGVDINKEYNDVMLQISNEQTISLYGGAGSLPNRPNNPTFDQPNNVELNNLTIKEYDEKVLAQNEYYQYVFMWTYRIILPSLIVFNIVLTLINTLTFGSLVILIAQTILDITFSTIQILKSEKDYENTKELRKNIDNIISQSNNYENLSTIFNANSLAINLFMLLKQDWVESAINTLAKKILKIKNEIIYNTKLRLKISSKIVSVLSISFTIIMTILEDNLIKDGI